MILACSLLAPTQLLANTEPIPKGQELLQVFIKKYRQGLETETNHDSTYFYLVKAKELAGDIGADSLLAEVKDAFAYFMKGRGKVKEAAKLLQENIDYALGKKDSFLLMRTYIAMGNNYFPFVDQTQLPLDSLIFYAEKGLQIAKNRKDILHTLIAQQNLAEHYNKIPNLKEKALPLLLETVVLTDQHPEGIYFKAPAYRDLATYYLEDKKYSKAVIALEKSIEYGKTHESYGSLLMAHKDLQSIYETIGDYKKSLAAYKTATFYQEKLRNEEAEKQLAALEVEFEAERQANQISELQRLNKAQEDRSKRQQVLLISLLLGAALIGGLAYLAFRNNQKKQEALIQLSASQEEMANFKTRFYTNLTHEFRTPLTVIQGMANRILGNQESKEMILRNNQNLLNLVNQMLDLQKLDASALTTNYVQSDVVSYLRYLAEPFISLAADKNIHLTIYDEHQSLKMDFDASHLKQILDNLLNNAIKFTPAKGEVLLHLSKVHNHFQLKVKDNGEGIAEVHQAAVFDRFYQVPANNKQQRIGTGIGLALTKELVQLMEGTITLESELKQGTTFTVLLPIRTDAPLLNVGNLKIAPDLSINSTHFSKKTISQQNLMVDAPKVLIVEDNKDVLKFLELTLKEHCELTTARDGQAGMTQALETIPDLIISDIMMPVMDGLELCNHLKKDERTSHIPIILLTAKVSKVHQLEGLAEGADAYLTKPFEPQELLIRIEKILENRRKLQAYYLQWNPFVAADKLTPTKESDFLFKVKDIIEKQLGDEHFGVLQLCHALHLSRMQVHRKLKAVCGKSTAQFIREIRLQKAHQLLKTTDDTIAEIAYAVGFSDPNYFSKAFSTFFGFLPSVTRK